MPHSPAFDNGDRVSYLYFYATTPHGANFPLEDVRSALHDIASLPDDELIAAFDHGHPVPLL